MPRSEDIDVGGGARPAAPPRPLRGRRNVPIPNIRCIAVLVRICAASVAGSHLEEGNGREQQVPPHPVGGGFIPCSIRLGGKRTIASHFFRGGGGVGGATTMDEGRKGGRESECDGSALTKLGGGMTGTALTMLTAGITTSHLCMHRCELRRRQRRRRGGGFAVDGHGRHRGSSGPHPGKEGLG